VADNVTISWLLRFKDDAAEVREGFEAGLAMSGFGALFHASRSPMDRR
jgi:hypothetical protein